MGDIRKRAAVDKRRSSLESLHKVGLYGVLQKRRHSSLCLEPAARHGAVLSIISDDDARKARFKVGSGLGKAEYGHNFAGNGDVKAVIALDPVLFSAEAVADIPELPVVHIDASAPGYSFRVNSECVSVHDMVIYHRGQQIVRRADGVDIAGEVEVNVLHGNYLRIASAARSALYSEHRAKRRLAQCSGRIFADLTQAIGKTYSSRGLALACRCRRYGRNKDELAVGIFVIAKIAEIDLGLIFSVALKPLLAYADFSGYILNRAHTAALCDLKISFSVH